ncbi:unannotated protein [freshwater metagenome]|uniref:Unannotated protein n=1 Tax=freshwater metagenome TaxID=449393 RepID=A0A6J6BMM0_9ZZZZ
MLGGTASEDTGATAGRVDAGAVAGTVSGGGIRLVVTAIEGGVAEVVVVVDRRSGSSERSARTDSGLESLSSNQVPPAMSSKKTAALPPSILRRDARASRSSETRFAAPALSTSGSARLCRIKDCCS